MDLPPLSRLEEIPDPKATLYQLLRQASGLGGRRLKRFPVERSMHRIAENIDDFSSLRQLPAFAALEADIRDVTRDRGWCD